VERSRPNAEGVKSKTVETHGQLKKAQVNKCGQSDIKGANPETVSKT